MIFSEPNQEVTSAKCKSGDRMGCGILFPSAVTSSEEREPVLVLVYFTMNGQLVHTRRMRQPRGGFFPCVSMNAKGNHYL